MSLGYQCHSISQSRPDAFTSIPDLTIKGLDKLQVFPISLPVAHQTAINIQQASSVSNQKRIRKRPCERSTWILLWIFIRTTMQRDAAFPQMFLPAQFLLILSGWGINKEVWSKNTSKADQQILDGKIFTEDDPDRVMRNGLVPMHYIIFPM